MGLVSPRGSLGAFQASSTNVEAGPAPSGDPPRIPTLLSDRPGPSPGSPSLPDRPQAPPSCSCMGLCLLSHWSSQRSRVREARLRSPSQARSPSGQVMTAGFQEGAGLTLPGSQPPRPPHQSTPGLLGVGQLLPFSSPSLPPPSALHLTPRSLSAVCETPTERESLRALTRPGDCHEWGRQSAAG